MQFQYTQQEILLRKIGRRRDEIKGFTVSNITPITSITYRETRDFEAVEQALKATDYRPIAVGDNWGGGMNAWFRMQIVVPREWKGREAVAFLDLGGEGCIFIDGKPYQGLSGRHQEVVLTRSAKGGERFDILIDALSGAPWDTERLNIKVTNEKSLLSRAETATRNAEVRDYWYDLDVLHILAGELPKDSTRRARIIYTLNKSVDAFDYTNTDDASLRKSAVRASAILKPLLECRSEPSAMKLAVVGHSHIDCAWQWPYRETKRKCSRTFSTVMRLMEQYPEYTFTQGQALLYSFVKETYPTLYEEIRKRVKEGRWDVTGSMWVEADCNLSSGESLVRQVLVGKSFFKDEFGIETDVLWLPDVFGYSAALPQILKKAGVDYFFTNKIHWSDTNKPPYGTFHWKGIDGTRVLAHFPPSASYNGVPDATWFRRYEREWQDKDRADEILLTYGFGDGGGGPTINHVEQLRRSMDLEGLPRLEQKKVPDFFHGIDRRDSDYHEWSGELYLEYHRGTYTTQARNKRLNRKAELLYRDAELLSSIASPLGLPYPREELQEQWRQILSNQFHDIIPGTSIRQVYEDTDAMYAKAFETGERVCDRALQTVAGKIDTRGEGDAIVVFNSLPWERTDIVSVDVPAGEYAVLDGRRGEEVPSQGSDTDGSLAFAATVPSMGYATYRLVRSAPAKAPRDLRASKNALENRFYRIEFDARGMISSLLHKKTGREVLPEGERANVLRMYEDKPINWPAWDIDFFHEDKYEDISGVKSIRVVEEGPVRAALEIEREFGKSRLRQRVVIYSDIRRIDFETWVDWHENEKVLKALFPVDVNAATARYEIQFGNVERPTHSNTSWDFARFEVCAHKWVDFSEAAFGVSLMNDCKYGHSTRGNVMRLTLLRSAKRPDKLADMCEHVFTYSLMPHASDYTRAGTVRQAYGLNVPLRAVVAKPAKGALPGEKSFVEVNAENVVLETVKRAEKEDATILRFYECHNRRARVNVTTGLRFRKVYECSLMEGNIDPVAASGGGFSFEIKPFEIKTFKLV